MQKIKNKYPKSHNSLIRWRRRFTLIDPFRNLSFIQVCLNYTLKIILNYYLNYNNLFIKIIKQVVNLEII